MLFTGYNADIICLQEVDRKIFEQDLLPNFKDIGFSGLLSLKTGDVAEGTATFFRCNKFRSVCFVMHLF
jgi:2',5'-phosphodiesterase